MTLAPFIVVALLFGIVTLVGAGRAGTGLFAAIGGLLLALLMAILLPITGSSTTLAGEPILVDGYVRLFLVFAATAGLLLLLSEASAPRDRSDRAAPAFDQLTGSGFLLFLGGAGIALAVATPLPALGAATAAGFGALLVAARASSGALEPEPSDRSHGAVRPVAARLLPTRLGTEALRLAAALLLASAALALLIGRGDVVAGEPFGVGATALILAGAVALRLGIAPLHVHAARLAESPIRAMVALLSVWAPALFAVVALAGAQAAIVPLGLPLVLERGAIAGLAILTIVVGFLAAIVQDDIEHVAAYSILQDLAVGFFAFAAVDAASWGPGRTWLLVIAVAKTALLGWTIVAARTFGTRSLADLRGWARGGLLLALAFGVITAATVGIPGFASFGARVDLVDGALAPPIGTVVLLLSLSTLLVHGRVLAIGLLEPTVIVRAADDERLRRLPPDLRRRVSETARQTLDLNRAPVAAAIVAVLALVAFSASAGLFGLDSAAAEDIPAALPGAQPTFGPVATFEPVPTESPPVPSASPSSPPAPTSS